jgi:leucyl/phenylalanyl-tRNA--protein transferase
VHILNKEIIFPDPSKADRRGCLAFGGDLSTERLLLAYRSGIFPWFNEGQPISWFSPNPRMVLFPDKLYVSKTMKQVLSRSYFKITYNTAFEVVMQHCAKIKRDGQYGTWITQDMIAAYVKLHELGFAHSVEAWQNEELVGGLYGISLGKCFFGESMFAKTSNASKAAFITFVKKLETLGFGLIDCQMHTEHLASLGAELIPRTLFLNYLKQNQKEEELFLLNKIQ